MAPIWKGARARASCQTQTNFSQSPSFCISTAFPSQAFLNHHIHEQTLNIIKGHCRLHPSPGIIKYIDSKNEHGYISPSDLGRGPQTFCSYTLIFLSLSEQDLHHSFLNELIVKIAPYNYMRIIQHYFSLIIGGYLNYISFAVLSHSNAQMSEEMT